MRLDIEEGDADDAPIPSEAWHRMVFAREELCDYCDKPLDPDRVWAVHHPCHCLTCSEECGAAFVARWELSTMKIDRSWDQLPMSIDHTSTSK